MSSNPKENAGTVARTPFSMEALISGFADQLLEALEHCASVHTRPQKQHINSVLVSGMGGSGIGGAFVRMLCADQLEVPMLLNQGYGLPAFVGPQSLVLFSSYSGNTEETLSVFRAAARSGASLAAVTSGGELGELAASHQVDLVKVPGGFPPRTRMGWSIVAQLHLLASKGLIDGTWQEGIDRAAAVLRSEGSALRALARSIAPELMTRTAVFYGAEHVEPVLIRARQQLNENAKVLCWHHTLPEMNHNELVGWASTRADLLPIFIRDRAAGGESEAIKRRMAFTEKAIGNYAEQVIELDAGEGDRYERSFRLVHLVDWISYELAVLRGVDPIDIAILNRLKEEMARGR